MSRTNYVQTDVARENGEPCPCITRPTLWQNLCSARFLGVAEADGSTKVPGYYAALIRVGDAKAHGNFGVGEFENLRGELFAMDNEFYELRADGTAHLAADGDWLNVTFLTFFEPEETLRVESPLSFKVDGTPTERDLSVWLSSQLPSPDSFYSMSVVGDFENVVVSAIPEQSRPYLPFSEARKLRQEHVVEKQPGRMVAYFTPNYLGCVGVPGLHFHFLNDARTKGGHVERFTVNKAVIRVQRITRLDLGFPEIQND